MALILARSETQASAVIDFFPRAGNEIGQPSIISVWNAYNKISVAARVRETGASWSVAVAAGYNNLNGSGNNRCAITKGLAEDDIIGIFSQFGFAGAASSWQINILVDGLTAAPGNEALSSTATSVVLTSNMTGAAQLGFHTYILGQKATGSNPATLLGNSGGIPLSNASFQTMY